MPEQGWPAGRDFIALSMNIDYAHGEPRSSCCRRKARPLFIRLVCIVVNVVVAIQSQRGTRERETSLLTLYESLRRPV